MLSINYVTGAALRTDIEKQLLEVWSIVSGKEYKTEIFKKEILWLNKIIFIITHAMK